MSGVDLCNLEAGIERALGGGAERVDDSLDTVLASAVVGGASVSSYGHGSSLGPTTSQPPSSGWSGSCPSHGRSMMLSDQRGPDECPGRCPVR